MQKLDFFGNFQTVCLNQIKNAIQHLFVFFNQNLLIMRVVGILLILKCIKTAKQFYYPQLCEFDHFIYASSL